MAQHRVAFLTNTGRATGEDWPTASLALAHMERLRARDDVVAVARFEPAGIELKMVESTFAPIRPPEE
jgi:hypothetical protein